MSKFSSATINLTVAENGYVLSVETRDAYSPGSPHARRERDLVFASKTQLANWIENNIADPPGPVPTIEKSDTNNSGLKASPAEDED
jgi:hypothetical protein